jgi:hypothetical protein
VAEVAAAARRAIVGQRSAGAPAAAARIGTRLEHHVDGAGDALRVEIRSRAAQQLDALDQLRRNAVDEGGTVVAAAGETLAVDQHLRVFGPQTAELRRLEGAGFGGEDQARQALEHVAGRARFETQQFGG